MEEVNNYNTNKGNKKVVMVVILVVVGIIAGALYFLMGGQDNGDVYFNDGIANAKNRFISFAEQNAKEQGDYSYGNQGYIKEFEVGLEEGENICAFFVYDDYERADIGLEDGVGNFSGGIRFTILNQADNGTTTGYYESEPALYVRKPENSYTYLKYVTVQSRGKSSPLRVITNLEEYTGFYVTCYDPSMVLF